VLTDFAETQGFGQKKVNYKLRDWLFSRQRYWGEPIPLIHLAKEDLKKIPHIHDITQAIDPEMAYVLKRPPHDGERTAGATCNCSGNIRELVSSAITIFHFVFLRQSASNLLETETPH